ncbi:MAG: hypothetical protein ACR2N3_03345 [Pyrinomonadaceae bacterium]
MELNKLSYQTEETNARRSILWFELLIDGETVEKLIEDEKAIPYYLFEDEDVDLPALFDYEDKKYHIIGVCTCGHFGCGSTDCEIEKDENFVNLKVIFRGSYKPPKDFKFKFSRENYDSVIGEIKKRAKEYKEKINNRLCT